METIIISSESKGNIKLLKELAKKLGDSVKTVSLEQKEDIAFGQMLKKAESGNLISKESILNKLREI
jgi:hypothetical protein